MKLYSNVEEILGSLVPDLLNDIRELERQRDGIGRHTTISAEAESLMSKHQKLFDMYSKPDQRPVASSPKTGT